MDTVKSDQIKTVAQIRRKNTKKAEQLKNKPHTSCNWENGACIKKEAFGFWSQIYYTRINLLISSFGNSTTSRGASPLI